MQTTTTPSLTTELAERFNEVREYTEKLAEPLSPEDQCTQSMPDVSPTKWHRAHTSWFFETFILLPNKPNYEVYDPDYNYLFNSYYEHVGPRHARPDRGLITRPSAGEISEYRKYVNAEMLDFLTNFSSVPNPEEILYLVVLGIHHEQQHQELLLMDIKHVLYSNPKLPVYLADFPLQQTRYSGYLQSQNQSHNGSEAASNGWQNIQIVPDGKVCIGHKGEGFSFDNETPQHQVVLNDFELSTQLVTYGDWLDFMAAGGYETPTLWLSDGWHQVQQNGWTAPEYLQKVDDGWQLFTLSGAKELNLDHPVGHISYYEADAFARWAGCRLPTEFEWEHSLTQFERDIPGLLWEWTASPYCPYPGFEPAKGAVGEYNGKFMVNQMVLRGGCWATPPGHIRASYRNFYGPGTRWHFSGLRMVRDTNKQN